MVPSSLLSVADALALVLASAPEAPGVETVPLSLCAGRTLALDLAALRTQPPFAASAMDGYAARAADLAPAPATLDVIGVSAAGHSFAGTIGPGQAARIFTGAPVPEGADTVIIQENTQPDGARVKCLQSEPVGRNIRRAGLDFVEGDVLLPKGRRLGACELALAGAMNHGALPVARRPRVALLATGDELVAPGESPGADQIVASNTFAVRAYAEAAGAETIDLGIAGDNLAALEAAINRAREARADVLVTLGGASVGDHDLVQTALTREGMQLSFWKIAMRPGKPLMHGRIGDMRILGLPGNPVSAIVCGVLFLAPLIRALCGDPEAGADHTQTAILGVELRENDSREDYLRASLAHNPDGLPIATPFGRQDSSMLRVLAQSECLVIRPPRAPAAKKGDHCRVIRL